MPFVLGDCAQYTLLRGLSGTLTAEATNPPNLSPLATNAAGALPNFGPPRRTKPWPARIEAHDDH